VDGVDNSEFSTGGIKVPSGTTAQRDPNAVVGSLRYNTTTGFFETFTGSGWGAVATPPNITGISPNNFNGEAGATFTVDGAFFDAETTALFKGADGTEYAAATVTYVSSTQITITNATNLPVANEPFKLVVTNGAGLSVESVEVIDAGSVPAFTTAAGNLATTTQWDDAVSVTVQAADAENTISSYSVTQGNLPAGLSLDAATGAITGTSTGQTTTTYTFTIGATDSAGNTNTRQFNIQIVNAAPVWSSPAEGGTEETPQNSAASITLNASDPEGEAISYSAASLPTGLFITGNTISGTPTAVANTSVAVTASDGFASTVRNFFINVVAPSPLMVFGSTQSSPLHVIDSGNIPAGTVYYAIMGGGGSGAGTHYQGGGSGFVSYGSFNWSGGTIVARVGGRSGVNLNQSNVNLQGIDGQATYLNQLDGTNIVTALGGKGGGGSGSSANGFSGGGGAGNSGYGGYGGSGGGDGSAGANITGGTGQGSSVKSAFYSQVQIGLTSNGRTSINVNDGNGGDPSSGSHQGGGGGGGILIDYTGAPSSPVGLNSNASHGGGTGGEGWGAGGGAAGYNGTRGSTGNGAPGFALVWF
jgi:hypothetical protein